MKRQSPMSAIEPMIRREREMYHELKHQNAELLEALKEMVESWESMQVPNNMDDIARDMLRVTNAIMLAKQAIAKAEGKE